LLLLFLLLFLFLLLGLARCEIGAARLSLARLPPALARGSLLFGPFSLTTAPLLRGGRILLASAFLSIHGLPPSGKEIEV
jgi:hypothetical protein